MNEQINTQHIISGETISAINRIKLYSANEWEEFIEEWASSLDKDYLEVERLGGAGDKGRDVVGIISESPTYKWDNYQCKHYDHPLVPTDIWTEIGKLSYYTFIKDYTLPEQYYFIAPQGVGTTLSDLLKKPSQLKRELLENWDKKCKNKITSKQTIELTDDLRKHIDSIDFKIFRKKSPLSIIKDHSKTHYHIARFGGGLPKRPVCEPAPTNIQEKELNYINKLLKSYSSEAETSFEEVHQLPSESKYKNHLDRTREHFHRVEQLQNFIRDKLPPSVFETFKSDIKSGIINIVEEEHSSGYKCILAVESEARKLSLSDNPISLCSNGNDRVGTCHHLANDDEINWTNN